MVDAADSNIKFNSLGQIQAPTSSASQASGSASASSQPIEFPKEKPINDEQRAVMRRFGYNADDPADVKRWNELPQQQKDSYIDQYYREKQPMELIQADFSAPALPDIGEILDKKVKETVEQNTKQNSVTLPSNWDKMTVKEKQQFIENTIGQNTYGKEKWDSFDRSERKDQIKKFYNILLEKADPNFNNLNDKEQRHVRKDFIASLNVILDELHAGDEVTNELVVNKLKAFYDKSEADIELEQDIIKDKNAQQSVNQFQTKLAQSLGLQDVSELTTQQEIDALKSIEAKDNKLSPVLKQHLKDLEYKLGLEEYAKANNINEINEDVEYEYLQKKQVDNTLTDTEAKRLDDISINRDISEGMKEILGTDDFSKLSDAQIVEILSEKQQRGKLSQDEMTLLKNAKDTVYCEKSIITQLAREMFSLDKSQEPTRAQKLEAAKSIPKEERTETQEQLMFYWENMLHIKKSNKLKQQKGQFEPFSFDKELQFDRDTKKLIHHNKENAKKLKEYIESHNLSAEEFLDLFSRASEEEQDSIRFLVLDKGCGFPPELYDKLNLKDLFGNTLVATVSALGKAGSEVCKQAQFDAADALKEYKDDYDQDGIEIFTKDLATYLDTDATAYLGSILSEMNDSKIQDIYNQAVSQRDDYNEITNMISSYAESKRASSKSEAGSSASSKDSSTSSKDSSYSNTTNPISYTAPETKQINNNQVSNQPAEVSITQLDLHNEADQQKLVEIISQDSSVLGKLDPQKKQAVLEAYCKQADGARLFELFKKNPSLYSELLNLAYAKINIYKDEMFKVLISKSDSDMEKFAKELDINLSTFAEHNRDYATKVAIKTKDSNLAKKIVNNHALYGLQMGSSEHFELLRISSNKQNVANEVPVYSQNIIEEIPPRLLGLG